ncbi:Crp/Fnr family transcriptional regulator [Fuchsiella alkaliacetigena]|uniref:Crp/Fnr family transcriptional regulator n=1 Tax=Fuchsiella alkaliacetigena TaxID=957042 RepID=UPI00200B3F8A|nr:Crp/Fnr family transcriptional regulator [Fuchsiella alkaliacetigena]MCK8823764.1 Crp/Fnr family transcriptional regulator [Fuchsiella alkaliacetigena]
MTDDFLENFILFQDLSFVELEKIKQATYIREYAKDEIIFMEGEPGDAFYIILSGAVKVFKIGQSGKEKTLTLLNEGDFFGEMALLEKNVRSASVEAIKDSCLYVFERSKFNSMIYQFPEIAVKMIAVLSNRLRAANKLVEDLTFKGVKERLAETLKDLVSEYDIRDGRCALIIEGTTHQELANLTGSTSEFITKLLGEMVEDEGLIIEDESLILFEDYIENLKIMD